MKPDKKAWGQHERAGPRLELRLTVKRRALLKTWLENAMFNNEDPKRLGRFYGQTYEDSAEVKKILDDIYTFCSKGTQDNDNGRPGPAVRSATA